MKRTIFRSLFVAVVLGVFLQPAGAHADKDDTKAEAKPDEKKDASEESHLKRDANGNVVVTLNDDTQKRIALKIEPLAAAQMTPELKAYGSVVDAAPLAALMTELAAAQASYTASSNELARLKTLAGSGNASARALENAEAAALRDQLTVQSTRDKLLLTWGREITEQSDVPAFLKALTSLDTVLVRVDLPAGRRLETPPTSARVMSLSGNSAEAELLGVAMGVDPQTQGQGYIFQIKTNNARFLPGEAVTGHLKLPGEPLAGVVIPRDAVVRAEGRGWVYVAGDKNDFTRKEIALDHVAENGWFVTNGVAANEPVVVSGAQALLSEEQKAAYGPPD